MDENNTAPRKNPVTLKPGLLVALSTRVTGGVEYSRRDLAPEEVQGAAATAAAVEEADMVGGAKVEAWETVKVTEDPEEFARAIKVRGACRTMITRVCIASPFGLLCPTKNADALDRAIDEARKLAAAHNVLAKRTRVDLWCIRGQIVESDTDAAKGIAAEIKSLLDQMDSGISERDAEKIRDAAKKAKALGGMLDDTVGAKVDAAIAEARAAAREIVRTLEERAGKADIILMADSKRALKEARFAFLDLDVPEAPAQAGDALPVVAPRGLDLEGDSASVPKQYDGEAAPDGVPLPELDDPGDIAVAAEIAERGMDLDYMEV